MRDAVDKKVRGVVDGTKQTLNKWKGEVRNINYVLLFISDWQIRHKCFEVKFKIPPPPSPTDSVRIIIDQN